MTMGVPAELRYTQEHEWISVEGSTATIGITDFATQALGDVVYVSLPTVGAALAAGEPCGEVESTKSVSDLYAPVDGEVLEVNEELNDDPGLINAEPYGLGWMFKIRVADWQAAVASLLSSAEYDALTKSAG
jgi:glycine cleavage system H protein